MCCYFINNCIIIILLLTEYFENPEVEGNRRSCNEASVRLEILFLYSMLLKHDPFPFFISSFSALLLISLSQSVSTVCLYLRFTGQTKTNLSVPHNSSQFFRELIKDSIQRRFWWGGIWWSPVSVQLKVPTWTSNNHSGWRWGNKSPCFFRHGC